jgi:hypothetical protein
MIGMTRALPLVLALAGCNHVAAPSAASTPPAPIASSAAPVAPALLSSGDVDARLRAEWRKAGVTPTSPAADATWLRRAWIDIAGTIPPPEVTARFLADRTADKRARMIDELLAAPSWATHWTAYWDEAWMGHDARVPEVDRGAFRSWLHAAFARNASWSEVVTMLLTATGSNSRGGPRRSSDENDGSEEPAAGVNGAVNWSLRYDKAPQDLAGAASRTLLGVQIQCAQCHDHKTEKWTQRDFQAFAAAFVRTRIVPIDVGKAMGALKRVELRDLDRPAPRFGKMGELAPVLTARPTALDGTDLSSGDGVRAALARWITAPENPWFSRAFVNRIWALFVGRGFVDPVDDFRPSNAPVAPQLLDELAADFVRSGYDIKHLVRILALSEVYSLSAAPLERGTAAADPETRLWERFRVTPLGPEELLNALVAATRLDAIVRSKGRLDLAQLRFRVKQRYGFLFEVDEESAADEYEGTIAQALALLNGSVVETGASVLPGSALADVLAMPGDEKEDAARLEALYLRVLSRLPTPDETARWTSFLSGARASPNPPTAGPPLSKRVRSPKAAEPRQPDPLRGLGDRAADVQASQRVRAWEDVLWTLLNASEFVLNH